MNETIRVLKERRSIRKFTDQQVDIETVKQICDAGTYAACGRGLQAGKIVVVQDEGIIKKLSQLNAQVMGAKIDPFYGAKTILIVFADSNVHTYIEDGSLVLGNLMNASYALGVDSIWIHRAKEMFETPDGKQLMAKWGISDNYIGIGNCCIGYHDGPYPKPKERKKDFIVFE